MDSEPTPSQFSMSNFETLVAGIELLYGVGRKLSDAIATQPCEYLIQEASMAFVKTMMSVFGFLRFIPASRFFAAAGETVTDLSSASVMGRQVLEDTISFFYLSEPDLTPQEKGLRKLVWEFHGKSEHIDSGRLAAVPNVERSPVWAECERLRQAVRKHPLLETHPMLVGTENKRRRENIRNGREGQIIQDHEILKRRGICTERYDLPRKVLSNFAHFSKFSHDFDDADERGVAEELGRFLASNTCGGDVSRGITRGVYRNLSADSPAFKPGRARDRCEMAAPLKSPY